MMELKNIMKLLGGLGIPIAYHHFAEGESPEPPFLIYLTPGSHNFSADGMVYFKVKQLDVELYTDKKDLALEEKLEKILDAQGIFYNKTETYIKSEKLYEVLYELKNVHAAKLTEKEEGGSTKFEYGVPKAIPGAVSISLDAEGESSPFYADGIVYFRSVTNNGYSGDLEMALIPEWFRTEILQ